MSVILSSGVTPPFEPRSAKFWPSIREHKIPFLVYLVNYGGRKPHIYDGIAHRHVNYQDVRVKVPKTMMQHGAFTQDWDGKNDDVVVFCDADAVFQRSPTDEEMALFASVGENEFMAGRNKPDPTQTLLDESRLIGPKIPLSDIDALWPGLDRMLCRNFGFVVARISTWKKIYAGFEHMWPQADRCWWNPAVVQLLSLYSAYVQGIRCIDLPLSIHAHGHLGMPPGVEICADGVARHNGTVILFRHAL